MTTTIDPDAPVYSIYDTEDGTETYRVALGPGGGLCGTCEGVGQAEMRGTPHQDYDEPNYFDTCGICGGSGVEPDPIVMDIPQGDPLPEGFHWATRAEMDDLEAEREAMRRG